MSKLKTSTLSTSPYLHDSATTPKIMWEVNYTLIPIILGAWYIFGFGALLVTIFASLGSLVTEYIFAKEDPVRAEQKKTGAKPVSAAKQLEPLKDIRVWRFATYYFFVFGAFVAFASFLPRYYVGAYDVALTSAGVFAGMYSLPGSL